jgi:hypothetical protein
MLIARAWKWILLLVLWARPAVADERSMKCLRYPLPDGWRITEETRDEVADLVGPGKTDFLRLVWLPAPPNRGFDDFAEALIDQTKKRFENQTSTESKITRFKIAGLRALRIDVRNKSKAGFGVTVLTFFDGGYYEIIGAAEQLKTIDLMLSGWRFDGCKR